MFGQTLWQVDLLRGTCANGPSCKLYYTRFYAEQLRDKRGAKLRVFGKRGTEVCLLPKLYQICWIETHFLLDSCNFRAESKTREVN